MSKAYTKNTWQDEILSGAERYDIKDNGGTSIYTQVQILIHNAITQVGSALVAAWMNNIENGVDAIDTQLNVTEVGKIVMFAGASAPAGWVLCDGSSLLRAGTYAGLFAVIGTTYGSVDGTHFNVPDLRGRVPVGVGTGAGGGASGNGAPTGGAALTSRALADWEGEETHTLVTSEEPAHNHPVTDPGHHHNRNTFTAVGTVTGNIPRGGTVTPVNGQITDNATTGVTIGNTGGGGAHNNMQPSISINFIIKI